ncbi:hypothetical protein [Terrisporobacter sp.]|uniref:hypothetical protein n=1 Tax=Terrisporobacter sp. TaxID=1965305 RepID=UPI00289E9E6C|nr:hypothetical protein [Terrisporobacter sp.]
MRKCECGHEVDYDGYESIEIEDGFLVIKGYAKCPMCKKDYKYTDDYKCDFENPYDVELEEI